MIVSVGRNVTKGLKECYSYFKEDSVFDIKRFMKEFFEETMNLEINDQLKEMKRRRIKNSRNGFRNRSLLTSSGQVDLKVPRDRKSRFRTIVFQPYKRVSKNVEDSIVQMYLHGVSQRKVGEILDALTGVHVSAGFVSKVTKKMDEVVKEFHSRRFDKASFTYLFLDGLHARRMNAAGKQERCVVFAAYGVGNNGEREMLDFRIGRSESEAS